MQKKFESLKKQASESVQKNWLSVAVGAGITGYCLYDRTALSQACKWAKDFWTSMPTVAQLGLTGFALIIGSNLYKKQVTEETQGIYLTREEWERFKNEQLVHCLTWGRFCVYRDTNLCSLLERLQRGDTGLNIEEELKRVRLD